MYTPSKRFIWPGTDYTVTSLTDTYRSALNWMDWRIKVELKELQGHTAMLSIREEKRPNRRTVFEVVTRIPKQEECLYRPLEPEVVNPFLPTSPLYSIKP